MSKLFALIAASLLAWPAHAQFNLRDLNINKMLETVKSVGKATRDIDEPEEIAIGRDVAAHLLGAAPLVPDARLQRYVNHVGRWLASQSERPDLPWRFGVMAAPQVNAFAVPGGTIFITRGLLDKMTSEAELAGVLAHEIVHVVRKHHLKAIQKGALAGLSADAAGAALGNVNAEARAKLIAFGTEMYSRGLDKGDELEADRLGVVVAARGGYDAYGLPSVLQTLQAVNPSDSAVALMFKTHPAPAERLDMLASKMQPVLDAYAAQPQLRERFAMLVKTDR
ncbi:MAG TPA: M48 family metalloprotease [Burkholderiales bacterium]